MSSDSENSLTENEYEVEAIEGKQQTGKQVG